GNVACPKCGKQLLVPVTPVGAPTAIPVGLLESTSGPELLVSATPSATTSQPARPPNQVSSQKQGGRSKALSAWKELSVPAQLVAICSLGILMLSCFLCGGGTVFVYEAVRTTDNKAAGANNPQNADLGKQLDAPQKIFGDWERGKMGNSNNSLQVLTLLKDGT